MLYIISRHKGNYLFFVFRRTELFAGLRTRIRDDVLVCWMDEFVRGFFRMWGRLILFDVPSMMEYEQITRAHRRAGNDQLVVYACYPGLLWPPVGCGCIDTLPPPYSDEPLDDDDFEVEPDLPANVVHAVPTQVSELVRFLPNAVLVLIPLSRWIHKLKSKHVMMLEGIDDWHNVVNYNNFFRTECDTWQFHLVGFTPHFLGESYAPASKPTLN